MRGSNAMAKVRAENDLKQMEVELHKIHVADGQRRIEEGVKSAFYKPLQAKQKHQSKQLRMEAAIEDMLGFVPSIHGDKVEGWEPVRESPVPSCEDSHPI